MKKSAVVAFSGGLDTSFLVPFAKEQYGFSRVITCTVDTGGFDESERARIAQRSREVGADEHVFIDAQEEFYSSVLRYLIFGNVSRDGYPLSVGSERMIQAQKVVETARKYGSDCVLHGSTGAGNDQYRFDVAIQVFGRGGIASIAPIREFGVSRARSTEFLTAKGITVPQKNTMYSYNAGLWGVSIGGGETHLSTGLIPEEAWYSTPNKEVTGEIITIEFKEGIVSRLQARGQQLEKPVDIIKELAAIGNSYAIGRHYHVGTSIPGKKGRLAYESPAADLIYEAHRTLEKITLTQAQISSKKILSEEYGRLIHEARFFDPVRRDIEAYLESSQRTVTGHTKLELMPRAIKSTVADSPFNLLAAKGATYGEVSDFYDGRDAQGACRLHGFEQFIYETRND